MELIAFVGKKRAGKTTAARHICNVLQARRESFATPIKEHVERIFGPLEETPKEMVRPVMQALGESLKLKFGKYVFIDQLEERVGPDPGLVIVDDLRFPFEADWVRDHGGSVIRVTRPSNDWVDDFHVSETSVDQVIADATVLNTGGVEQLLAEVTNTVARLRDENHTTDPIGSGPGSTLGSRAYQSHRPH